MEPMGRICRANLDEQEEVWILTLGGCSVALLDVVLLNIDTLGHDTCQNLCKDEEQHDELTISNLAGLRMGYLESTYWTWQGEKRVAEETVQEAK